jgi:hypothetical protein
MFLSSQGLSGVISHNSSSSSLAGEARLRWLRATRQLDTMSSRITKLVQSATGQLSDERSKAVALHDRVKTLLFGCSPDYSKLTASQVLDIGMGDCFTKGMLFVALLRAAQIPARLRFVSLPTAFLRGIIETEEATIMHAMAEVYLQGQWIVTDSYVPDHLLQAAARLKLRQEGKQLGYGIHSLGSQKWDGLQDASAQCHSEDPSSLPTVDWDMADDPESFYADPSHSELRRNFATRLKWRLAAPIVNKRVAALRDSLPRGVAQP